MSDELKNKLFDYEAVPPPSSWEKISTALEQEIIANFPKKLFELEVTPPANAWERISLQLDITPGEQYAAKLYGLAIEPPEPAWDKISSALDHDGVKTIGPAGNKLIPIFKWAAAAAVLVAIAFGAFEILNRQGVSQKSETAVTVPKASESASVPGRPGTILPETALSNNLPKEGSGLAMALSTRQNPRKSSPEQVSHAIQADMPALAMNIASASPNFLEAVFRGEVPGNCGSISSDDPYLMFLNPNGYLIRISKKFAETLGCGYTKTDSKQFLQCQDQINQWRDELAKSPASSSPDNFASLVDIIKSEKD